MKSFFKTVLACLVGIMLAGIVSSMFYTCTFIGLVSALSEGEKTVTKSGDVFILKINSAVSETEPSMPVNFNLLSGFSLNENTSLRQICQAIDVAENDPNIAGIYLNTDGMLAAPATYEAIRARLARYKNKTGNFIIAYNDGFSTGQYFLSSVADSIYLNPLGEIDFNGMSTVVPYYKDLLDKLGIEIQTFRVGTFKSAVEPAILEHMSDANREQVACYLNTIWNNMLEKISESRGISVDSLNALADQGVGYMLPKEIFATGLVTAPKYKSEITPILEQLTGKDFHGVTLKQLAGNYDPKAGKGEQEIAVLYATGEIISSAQDKMDNIYWEDLIKEIKKLQKNDNVKAVVLRVNSPGGSGFASEQIWKALTDLKEKKPLVVSMSDYAASGGYYISCLADYIIAEPSTLTGSIGVFGQIPNFSGLTSGKLGVNFEEVKTNRFGALTTMRAATPQEKNKIQRGIEQFYDIFLTRCAEGRTKLTKDSIATIAEGRVWTGKNALQNGLIDELGDLYRAIDKAAALAKIETGSYYIGNYPNAETGIENLFKQFTNDATIRIADKIIGTDRAALRFIERLEREDRIQAFSFDRIVL